MFLEIQTHFADTARLDKVFINLKKQAISISVNTFTVYTFDLDGRLITAFKNGHTFRRGLDNRIMEKWSVLSQGHRERVRQWLNSKEKRALLEDIHEQIWTLYSLVQQGNFEALAASGEDVENITLEILTALEKILYFDFFQLEKDAQNFCSLYGRVGILPPDMYLSLLLQATQGCSYNRCNYCNFYQGVPYRVKSGLEFHRHIQAVKEYFGQAIRLRKYLFLGEANALDVPQSRLVNFFDAINQEFMFSKTEPKTNGGDLQPVFHGIYSFLTAFHRNQKTADDFAELRAKNLRRVYIGMETGCDVLLQFLNKPGDTAAILRLVETIKQGGVNVGIIILLGAGGDKFYDSHTTKTAEIIRAMNLDKGDIVYFSPIIQFPETSYSDKLDQEASRPLTEEEIEMQRCAMIDGFGFYGKPDAPKLALYDINEFIY
jgi:radical SAM superfamily enzyme YgiQ (UPF0313 family)